eukprot:3708795-Rhodomonas_salina.1
MALPSAHLHTVSLYLEYLGTKSSEGWSTRASAQYRDPALIPGSSPRLPVSVPLGTSSGPDSPKWG